MSLRPQESIRKAIAAGYGNLPSAEVASSPDDGTYQLCRTTVAVEMGDWVTSTSSANGHPSVNKPSGVAAQRTWAGVVTHKAGANQWVRIKTTGLVIAKVDPGASPGDKIHVQPGSFSAKKGPGTFVCGRLLYYFSGDDRLALVHVGGSVSDDLTIHHHDDGENTKVTDKTVGTREGRLWHVWRVISLKYTGETVDDYRMATCLGGGTEHGENPLEGYGWAGVIGLNAQMGFGQIGGNETTGNIGVLGAEDYMQDNQSITRINIRSWAGVNARDRYGVGEPVVGPIRYTWCETDETPAKWYVPDGCDCIIGITPREECGSGLWWAGTMRMDSTVDPATPTSTNWHRQWVPQFRVERDCKEVYSGPDESSPFPCGIVYMAQNLNINKDDVEGPYEWVIPYNYVPCTGRLDVLTGLRHAMDHIVAIWKFFYRFTSTVDQMFKCVDTRLIALGQPGCCGTVDPAIVPLVGGGPLGDDCATTECD